MFRLNRIFAFPVVSSIAQRDEKVLRICCPSPTTSLKNVFSQTTDRVPGDSCMESTTSALKTIPRVVKHLETSKSLDTYGKRNFDMCKKITTPKNHQKKLEKNSNDSEELKNKAKTYAEIIKEYSEQIESKIALQNEEKNRFSGIFSKTTIDKISSLAGIKKNNNDGDNSSGNSSQNNSSSSNRQNPSGKSTKKFEKNFNEEPNEISVIIEPLTTDLHSNMSDMGVMMITVREKITSTRPFQSVDLRINGESVTRVNQINTKFPNLNVTSSSGKYEIKIPITVTNKSKWNLLLSELKESKSETAVSLSTMTGYSKAPISRSLMSKVVPWWTTLESFRALETLESSRHYDEKLQHKKSSKPVADITKDVPKTYGMIKILHDNNSSNFAEKLEVKVNLKAKPVKSASISQMDHDKGVRPKPVVFQKNNIQKSDMKILNSLTNTPQHHSFNSKNRIPPNNRFPETRLRYAPAIKLSVSSIKKQKVEKSRNMVPWTSAKSPSPTHISKIGENEDVKMKIASEKSNAESSVSLPLKFSVISEKMLNALEIKPAQETMILIKKGKGGNLIDDEHGLPTLKKPERKLHQLDLTITDKDNRLKKEVSPTEEVIAKKSAVRDASPERIIKTQVKNQNEQEPAKSIDGQGPTTKVADESVKVIRQDDKLNKYHKPDGSKEYFDEFFSVKPKADHLMKSKLKMELSKSHDKLLPSKNHAQSAPTKRQDAEKGSNSSDGNSQVTLQSTKTPGESGSTAYPEECSNTVCLKDESILSTSGTRSMRKFKMRLQRSMNRDMERYADTSVEKRLLMKQWSHVNLNQNTAKKILYSAWLNSHDEEAEAVTGTHKKLDD